MFDYRINLPDARPLSAYEIAQRARVHELARIQLLAQFRSDEGFGSQEQKPRSRGLIYNLLSSLGLL